MIEFDPNLAAFGPTMVDAAQSVRGMLVELGLRLPRFDLNWQSLALCYQMLVEFGQHRPTLGQHRPIWVAFGPAHFYHVSAQIGQVWSSSHAQRQPPRLRGGTLSTSKAVGKTGAETVAKALTKASARTSRREPPESPESELQDIDAALSHRLTTEVTVMLQAALKGGSIRGLRQIWKKTSHATWAAAPWQWNFMSTNGSRAKAKRTHLF